MTNRCHCRQKMLQCQHCLSLSTLYHFLSTMAVFGDMNSRCRQLQLMSAGGSKPALDGGNQPQPDATSNLLVGALHEPLALGMTRRPPDMLVRFEHMAKLTEQLPRKLGTCATSMVTGTGQPSKSRHVQMGSNAGTQIHVVNTYRCQCAGLTDTRNLGKSRPISSQRGKLWGSPSTPSTM